MPRTARSLLGVTASAAILLGALAICLVVVGQPSSAGTGPLTLPNPTSITSVDYAAPPLKVLLVGDSLAGTLGVGLGEVAGAYNVRLANAGMPGCSASMDGYIQLTYFIRSPGLPCVLGQPQHLFDTWQTWVDAYRPDVVVYLARSDLLNQQVDRRWTHVGRRAFHAWYAGRLHDSVRILSSRGAHVVLVTVPVSSEPTLNPRQADKPIRARRIAGLLRLAAARDPSVASTYDLGALLTPGYVYRASTDSVQLRCPDGIHLTSAAGSAVAADLFPRLWALVGSHRVSGGGRWTSGSLPRSTPSWYAKLNCG